jgi:alginate O-acetyltransferase complex protein AlgI
MALGGLWHGANWTFVLWGVGHGAGIVLVHGVRHLRVRLPQWLGIVLTFYFVAFLWILFRAPDLVTAARVAHGAFAAPWSGLEAFLAANAFVLVLLAVFFALHRWDHHETVHVALKHVPKAALVPLLVAAWVLAIAVSHGSSAKFIYFDF